MKPSFIFVESRKNRNISSGRRGEKLDLKLSVNNSIASIRKKSLLHLPVREFERKIEASRLKHYRGTLVNLLRQIKLMNFSFRFNLIVLFKDFFN